METDGGVPSYRPRTSRASVSTVLPEVDVFIHLLVLLRLLDSDSMEKVHVVQDIRMYCKLQQFIACSPPPVLGLGLFVCLFVCLFAK